MPPLPAQLFSCPFLHSAPANKELTPGMTVPPGPAQPLVCLLGLAWCTDILVVKFFDYQARPFLGSKKGAVERAQTQSLPSGGSNLLRVTEEADMSSWGTRKQGELRILSQKASWELSLTEVSASRASGKGIPGSDHHFRQPGPTDHTSWPSAAGVSFPP